LRVATFNINVIRSRLPNLLDWLARETPEVVCLQELKAEASAFPVGALEEAGYGAIWHGQKSWNGVAILARDARPLEIRRGLPDDPDPSQSRYIEAAVQGIIIGCLYLPNGNPQPGPKFDYKLDWMRRFRAHARNLLDTSHPVILAGDYNVIPTDMDIYSTRSWKKDALLQPESRSEFEALLEQGWTDALRHLAPEERIYTFWDYFRKHWESDSGLRIDHLLISPDLVSRLRGAGVDRWVRGEAKASDHAPTWIELDSL
jgi:exodeoxyribonuclease III